MKAIPLTPEEEALGRRLVWFEELAKALSDMARFVAYALAQATHEAIKIQRAFAAAGDLREVLDDAPPSTLTPMRMLRSPDESSHALGT
jgi:hypothetical protein